MHINIAMKCCENIIRSMRGTSLTFVFDSELLLDAAISLIVYYFRAFKLFESLIIVNSSNPEL